jgi:hypothetical protein
MIIDPHASLEKYVREIGQKVPERTRIIADSRNMTSDDQLWLNAQQKPHELQKVKNGKTKHARLVISKTGQGWVDAQPEIPYGVKKNLEKPMEIRQRGRKVVILFDATEYECELPNDTKIKPMRYQSVLTKTSPDDIASILEEMREFVAPLEGATAFINHGDDMLVCQNRGGVISWVEGDIADNDTAHADIEFRTAYLLDRFRGEANIAMYAQTAYPTLFRNPLERSQKVMLRARWGMRLISGSIITTMKNCQKSEDAGVAYAMFNEPFPVSSARVGLNVTYKVGEITDVSFLARIFYTKDGDDQNVKVCTDVASVIRKFGRITGDAQGKSNEPIHVRVRRHMAGVVDGLVHEPDTMWKRAIENRYGKGDYHDVCANVKCLYQRYKKRSLKDLNSDDLGIIKHYYPGNETVGAEEYLAFCDLIYKTPGYGHVIISRFVDTIMASRYGLPPVCI